VSEYEKTINQKLADLGQEFNTAKGFGFMGQLENNNDPQSDAARQQYNNAFQQPLAQAQPDLNQALSTPPAARAAEPGPDPKQVAQYMEPINTAMQGLKTEFGATAQELAQMKNQISELRSLQSAAPPAPDGTVDPVTAKLSQLEQAHTKLQRMAIQDRARSSLNSWRQKYPESDLGEDDFRLVWSGNNLDQNLGIAEGVNWDAHWEMVAKAKSLPKMQEKMRTAEMELERLRSNKPNPLNEMSSAPRSNRQPSGTGLPQSQLLGADGFDEDLYQEATNIMGGPDRSKGRFMGFNRALVEAQRRRSLRTAS
jgi:hypothetical protein